MATGEPLLVVYNRSMLKAAAICSLKEVRDVKCRTALRAIFWLPHVDRWSRTKSYMPELRMIICAMLPWMLVSASTGASSFLIRLEDGHVKHSCNPKPGYAHNKHQQCSTKSVINVKKCFASAFHPFHPLLTGAQGCRHWRVRIGTKQEPLKKSAFIPSTAVFLRHYCITGISHTDSYIIYAYVTARLCNAWLSERKTDTSFPVANVKTNWRKNALNCKQRPCSLAKLPCLALWVRISCSQVQEGLANSQQPCALFEYTMINVVSISPEQLRTERVLATCNPGKSFLPKHSANIYQTLATTFLDALVCFC